MKLSSLQLRINKLFKIAVAIIFGFCALCIGESAHANYVKTDTAQLRALDKVTGRTASIDLKVGEEASFGTLTIKARVCKTRPPEEIPENAAFLEIYNKEKKDKQPNRIFSGWMFSSSPALSALENPMYDVWLVKCAGKVAETVKADISESKHEDAEVKVIIGDEIYDDENEDDEEPEVIINDGSAEDEESDEGESNESSDDPEDE